MYINCLGPSEQIIVETSGGTTLPRWQDQLVIFDIFIDSKLCENMVISTFIDIILSFKLQEISFK